MFKLPFHSIALLWIISVVNEVDLHESFCAGKPGCVSPHGKGHPGYRGPGWQKCVKGGKWVQGCDPGAGGGGDSFDFKIDVPVIKYKKERKKPRMNRLRRAQQAQYSAMALVMPPRMPDHYYTNQPVGNNGFASDAGFSTGPVAPPITFQGQGQQQQWLNQQQVPSYSQLLQWYWQSRTRQPMQGPIGPPVNMPYNSFDPAHYPIYG